MLFYGGSFTFGLGVEDHETLPYRTGIKTDGRYRVYNFGFPGYGPHQMLASVQHLLADTIAGCKPKYLIYSAMWGHVKRAAGLKFPGRFGPRYVLNENGDVVLTGTFASPAQMTAGQRFTHELKLSKFRIYHTALRKLELEDHVHLFAAVVDASRNNFDREYPEGIRGER